MEEERSTDIDLGLQDLLGILRQCWYVMLAIAIVVGIGLYAFLNTTHEDEFTAQATIHVGSGGESTGGNSSMNQSDYAIANYLVQDCLSCAKQTSTLQKVIENSNLFIDAEDLAKRVTATNQTNTRFIFVSVTAADKEEAARLATELANVTCEEMNALAGDELCKVSTEATPPKEISNPISMLTILLVAVAAAVVVYVVYLIMFLMDDKINAPEDVEKYLQLSILGQIPNKQDAGRRKKYYAYDASSK